MNHFFSAAMLSSLLALSACQSTPTRNAEEKLSLGAISEKAVSFKVIDARPDLERTRRADDSPYDGPRIFFGDSNLTPDRMAVLKNYLQEKLGDKLAGKTITIEKFDIAETYLTRARQAGSGGGGTVSGSVGGVIGSGGRGAVSVGVVAPIFQAMQGEATDSRVECDLRVKVDGVAFDAKNAATGEAKNREQTLRQTVSGALALIADKLASK